MKSAKVLVPAGFTVTSAFTVSATGGKLWSAALVAGEIQLVKQGNDQLDPGQSVTVTFTATAPSLPNCTSLTYQWTSVGYNDDSFLTAFDLTGSQPLVTVTSDCPLPGGCTSGQGFWEHHYQAPSSWPASVLSGGLTLGTVVTPYTAAQLEAIFQQNPVVGNGLISLAHQLIAAKLNVARGANATAVAAAIAAADALIGSQLVPSGFLNPSASSALTTTLDQYNSGVIGPGACISGS